MKKNLCKVCAGSIWIKSSVSRTFIKCPRCRGTGMDFINKFNNLSPKEVPAKKVRSSWTFSFLKRKIMMCFKDIHVKKTNRKEQHDKL